MESVFENVGTEMILASDLRAEFCPRMSYRSAVRACPHRETDSRYYKKDLSQKCGIGAVFFG